MWISTYAYNRTHMYTHIYKHVCVYIYTHMYTHVNYVSTYAWLSIYSNIHLKANLNKMWNRVSFLIKFHSLLDGSTDHGNKLECFVNI